MVVLGSVGNIYLPSLKDRPLNVKNKNRKKKHENDIHDNDNNDNNNNDNGSDNGSDNGNDNDDDDDDEDDDRPAIWCGRGYRRLRISWHFTIRLDEKQGNSGIHRKRN